MCQMAMTSPSLVNTLTFTQKIVYKVFKYKIVNWFEQKQAITELQKKITKIHHVLVIFLPFNKYYSKISPNFITLT